MDRSITLAVDVDADPTRVSEILSSTDGQRAFWTADLGTYPGPADPVRRQRHPAAVLRRRRVTAGRLPTHTGERVTPVDARPVVLVRRPGRDVAAVMFHPGNDMRWTGGITASRPAPARTTRRRRERRTNVVRTRTRTPDDEMDRRAIACFDQALEDVGLTAAEPLRQVLHDYFAWATTTTVSRYHESADDVPRA
jgi:hypothetical protein